MGRDNLFISKHKDEYFYIILHDRKGKVFRFRYFLCDQLHGLKKFIMDFKKDEII